ncbi:hypothetical protein ACKVWC_010831 [Pyricularia oryzae]
MRHITRLPPPSNMCNESLGSGVSMAMGSNHEPHSTTTRSNNLLFSISFFCGRHFNFSFTIARSVLGTIALSSERMAVKPFAAASGHQPATGGTACPMARRGLM